MSDPTHTEHEDEGTTAAEAVTAGDAENDDAQRQGVFHPVQSQDEATDDAGRLT